MPAKAAVAAPCPFKGESFPEYVLHRAVRPPVQRCVIALDAIDSQTSVATPPPGLQSPTTVVSTSTVATIEHERPPPRRRPTGSVGSPSFSKRPTPSPSRRPSLSEQLKSISQGAQAITKQLTSVYNLGEHTAPVLASSSNGSSHQQLAVDPLAFQATTISLVVGKLECRFPCPVTFARDRCTYLFQHPFEAKEVLMIMYYRDMEHSALNLADRSFRFRLSRVLEQFGADYNPTNAQHWIRIVLATTSEAKKVKRFLADLRVIDTSRSKKLNLQLQSHITQH
ncbi:hypothetical protein BBJ28_00003885 [Nothophytophthora sp. Chile5]|nr:hypothetical protein BBJ28_00003885 [Nothophytophthora sp. Chile5]